MLEISVGETSRKNIQSIDLCLFDSVWPSEGTESVAPREQPVSGVETTRQSRCVRVRCGMGHW